MRTIETSHLWRVNDLDIFYTNETNGGGNGLGVDYFNVVNELYPDRIFEHALEWCSGPGFIGYAMLATGICRKLSLNDLYQPALDMAEITKVKNTKYTGAVSIYQGSSISVIPETEKFDLVLANPPHFPSRQAACNGLNLSIDFRTPHVEELLVDTNWNAHTDFYNNIKKRLTDDGVILIQENQVGSINRSKDFKHIIENAGLKIIKEFSSLEHYFPQPGSGMQIYYIEVKHR